MGKSVKPTKKEEPTYVLFGEEPCRILMESGFSALKKHMSNYGWGWAISQFTKESTIADILGEAGGWCGHAFLTKLQYKKLSEL